MLSITKRLLKGTTILTLFLGVSSTVYSGIYATSYAATPKKNESKSLTPIERLNQARSEFYREKSKNPVYRRQLYDINYNIRYNKVFAHDRRTLNIDTAWKAVMEKAWNPVKYIPHAIIKGIVLKETIEEDDKAAYFIRLSVQNPFIKEEGDKKFTVVREEISIDKINGIVYFMGRVPETSDYQILGVNANDAKPQIIFLDEHKIVKVDNEPFDEWTLVALPTKGFKASDQQFFVDNLGAGDGKPNSIYLQAQKLLK